MAKSLLQAAAADGFPVLDLTAYLHGAPGARDELAAGLRHALETVGFLVVVNHGVPQSMIEDVFAQAARLHALPAAAKQALSMGSGSVGYLAAATYAIKTSEINANRKPDLNEAFFIDRDRSPDDPAVREGKRFREVNKWPDGLPGFREATMASSHGWSYSPRTCCRCSRLRSICRRTGSTPRSPMRSARCACRIIPPPAMRIISSVLLRTRILRS